MSDYQIRGLLDKLNEAMADNERARRHLRRAQYILYFAIALNIGSALYYMVKVTS